MQTSTFFFVTPIFDNSLLNYISEFAEIHALLKKEMLCELEFTIRCQVRRLTRSKDDIVETAAQESRTYIHTLPGPVKVIEKHPSPPHKQVQNHPLGVILRVTSFSMATTDLLSTITISSSPRSRNTMVPPAFIKATLSRVPVIFCRQQPNPAQQHVVGEISKSQPVDIS